MSLKGFHLVFISVSVALALGVAWWGWERYAGGGDAAFLGVVAGALLAAGALIAYEVWFLRRMEGVES